MAVHSDAVSIAAAHGVAADRVRPLPSGVANHAYLLGDDLVLRVPRSPSFVADLRKEAEVIPVARAAGVRTAEVVAFAVTPVPHLVITRVPGRDMAGAERADVYREVGRELAGLHRITSATELVPVDGEPPDPAELVEGLRADGWIDAGAARWLTGWFEKLASPPPGRVLVHGDIAAQNILVGPHGLTGIVDWGDAMVADPAVDFAKISLAYVPDALAGYREAGAPASDWETRVLWHHLTWALARLRDPAPRPGERHWSAPPAARLLDIMRHLTKEPP